MAECTCSIKIRQHFIIMYPSRVLTLASPQILTRVPPLDPAGGLSSPDLSPCSLLYPCSYYHLYSINVGRH